MSLRHVATIRLFLLWLELQKADGFRPKVREEEEWDVVSGRGGECLLVDQLLLLPRRGTAHVAQRRRPDEPSSAQGYGRDGLSYVAERSFSVVPLRYEVEVRGFLPFKGLFDSGKGEWLPW